MLKGQEPYHQGAPCPELNKRGAVLEGLCLPAGPRPRLLFVLGCGRVRAWCPHLLTTCPFRGG